MDIILRFRGGDIKQRWVIQALAQVNANDTPVTYKVVSTSDVGAKWQSIQVTTHAGGVTSLRVGALVMKALAAMGRRVTVKCNDMRAAVARSKPLTPGQVRAREKSARVNREKQALRMAAKRTYIEWSVRGKDLGHKLDGLLNQARAGILATNPSALFPVWQTHWAMPHFIFRATLPVSMSADECEQVLRAMIAAYPAWGVAPAGLHMRSPVFYNDTTQDHGAIGLPVAPPPTYVGPRHKGKTTTYYRVLCKSPAHVQAVGDVVSKTLSRMRENCLPQWAISQDQPDYPGQPVCMLSGADLTRTVLEGLLNEFNDSARSIAGVTWGQIEGYKLLRPVKETSDGVQKLDDARTTLGKAQRAALGIVSSELTTEQKFERTTRMKDKEFNNWVAEAKVDGRAEADARQQAKAWEGMKEFSPEEGL